MSILRNIVLLSKNAESESLKIHDANDLNDNMVKVLTSKSN